MNEKCAAQVSYSGNQGISASVQPSETQSPVSAAISRVRDEISECNYWADLLIGSMGYALRPQPASEEKPPRLSAASPLADDIELFAENIRGIRAKLMDARERLTL